MYIPNMDLNWSSTIRTAFTAKGRGMDLDLDLDLYEHNTHPFIIKIWLEDTDHATWRGYITHVPTGERRALQDLEEISRFIVPYLEKLGVQFGPFWRIKQSLKWLPKIKFR